MNIWKKTDPTERIINADAVLEGWTDLEPGAFPKWDEESGAWTFDRDAWLNAEVRPLRDAALLAADNRVRRYDLQLRAGLTPKEPAEKINELLQYMQVLRDLTNNESLTPENLTWPEVP